ncbi:MAG: hypothetical protein L0211_14190 [Planctomycetaceae bacterium]|nr:hypothetical protein [Planctomycetaceae bacterium]
MASSHDDPQRLNPYAPSAIPQPLVPLADRGIGVWRDGPDIVMHPEATLPRYCVVTGEPARFGYFLRIAWSRPLDITPRSLGLYIPLSAQVHYHCRNRRWQSGACFLAACAIAALALIRTDIAGAVGIAVALSLWLVVSVLALFDYVQYSQFLYFASVEGDYLRLKGADQRFLQRLPEWNV